MQQHESHPLIQLVYVSCPARSVDLDDLYNIVRVAQRRNHDKDITGILSFGAQFFLQALEGPEKQVLECLDSIQQDSRHSDIRVVYSQPVAERCFPGWPMAYVPKPLLFEILRSNGVQLEWAETDTQVRNWTQEHASMALACIRQEPEPNISRHNPLF